MGESYFQYYVLNGGIMMIFLIPCFLLAVAFIIQGFINLRRDRIIPKRLTSLIREAEEPHTAESIARILANDRSSFGRVLRRVFHAQKPEETGNESDDQVSEIIEEEVARIYHNNNQLSIIYTISPLLGLLGTILGMMKTFYNFTQSADQSIALLSKGINEALVTTMWGLGIAIPSFIFLSIFRHRLFKYQTDLLPAAVRGVLRRIGVERSIPEENRPESCPAPLSQ